MSKSYEFTVNETMGSAIPASAAEMRVWIKADMTSAMAADSYRVSSWTAWIGCGEWSLDQIAKTVADVAAGGRADGVVMDRTTFRNYCQSLSLVSNQIGENPARQFDGRLDTVANPEKKRVRNGCDLVAFSTRADGVGAKDRQLWRVAAIHSRIAKRAEKPLDSWNAPDDIEGAIEEIEERRADQAADHDAAVKAYQNKKALDLANVRLANLAYEPGVESDWCLPESKLPVSKLDAWRRHTNRMEMQRLALQTYDLLISELRRTKNIKRVQELLEV